MALSCGIGGVVHAEGHVDGAQGIARNGVNLRVEERRKGRVHGEGTGVAVVQVHARSEHGHRQLATMLDAHGLQLAVQLHVLGGIEGELQSHVVERPGNLDTTVEGHAAPYPAVVRHSSLGALGSGNVECGVHGFASELDIGAVLDGEGLQRNDRQRVLHLAIGQRIATPQSQVVSRAVLHAQGAATHEVDVVGVVGIEIGHDVGTLRHVDAHVHLETVQRRAFDDHLCRIGKVGELDQLVQMVVGSEG